MAPMPSLPNSSNPVPQDPDRNSTQTNLQFIYFRKETRPGQSGGSTASNMPFRVRPAVSSSSLPQPSSNVSSPSLSSHANHPSPNTICDGLPSVQMTSATDTARITPTDHDLVTPQAPPSYGIPSPVNTMFRLPFLPTPSAQEVHFSEITDLVQVRIPSPDLSDCMQLFDPYAGHKMPLCLSTEALRQIQLTSSHRPIVPQHLLFCSLPLYGLQTERRMGMGMYASVRTLTSGLIACNATKKD
ncbi:hypothetical protein A0H81_06178 [Grifola frondosa]|uniref:Uncharacterized protein n=1 Tax=Grifola frondosa TaxID=5627 RepID=A0A1C7MCU7_GRIFR|nr:hypothetical protein A0H81_06178 [Grifola frondosa]